MISFIICKWKPIHREKKKLNPCDPFLVFSYWGRSMCTWPLHTIYFPVNGIRFFTLSTHFIGIQWISCEFCCCAKMHRHTFASAKQSYRTQKTRYPWLVLFFQTEGENKNTKYPHSHTHQMWCIPNIFWYIGTNHLKTCIIYIANKKKIPYFIGYCITSHHISIDHSTIFM